jgi:tRNA A37 threonylcarbamoyladenosine dehydratase
VRISVFYFFHISQSYRGVSKIRLIDFDYVTLSSLNRHATAGLKDVGTPKVTCIQRALKEIARWVEVDCRIDVWRKEDKGDLLEGADWVVGEDSMSPFRSLFVTCSAQMP